MLGNTLSNETIFSLNPKIALVNLSRLNAVSLKLSKNSM